MHCGDQRHLGLCLGYVPALAYGSCRVSDQGTTLGASDLHNARATILNPFNIWQLDSGNTFKLLHNQSIIVKASNHFSIHCCLVMHFAFKNWVSVQAEACSALSHHLNRCWLILNQNHRNKFQLKLSQNILILFQENAFKIVRKMLSILFRSYTV